MSAVGVRLWPRLTNKLKANLTDLLRSIGGPTETVLLVGTVQEAHTEYADMIFGHYDLNPGVMLSGRPTYQHAYTLQSSPGLPPSELFLFFFETQHSWVIARSLTGKGIVAVCHDEAPRPEESRSSWSLLTVGGTLLRAIQVSCTAFKTNLSGFRRFLQRSNMVTLIEHSLSHNEVADLCSELASPDTRLESLTLWSNSLRTDALRVVFDALARNTKLAHLHLRRNGINDEAAFQLGQTLRSNEALHTISLRDNLISDQGVTWIAEGLRNNNTVQYLSLRNNLITDAGAEFIADALKINKTLQDVRFVDNARSPNPV